MTDASLGQRLVGAFALVSVVAVGLMTWAGVNAVDRGVQAAVDGTASQVAADVADLAAAGYAQAGGWAGADLGPATEVATDAGYLVRIIDVDGQAIAATVPGQGRRAASATSDVVVDGQMVGQVWLVQQGQGPGAADRGRSVAWSSLALAAVAALAVAVGAAWATTRWLTAPLTKLGAVAEAVAAGRRDVRADETAPGELGRLGKGFNDAVDAVEQAAAVRRQMAADVAHELRTPLAALQAGLEELRDGLVDADEQTVSRLHAQSVRLGRVVGDLAVLSQVDEEAPGPLTGRLDLADVVAEELAARGPELRSAGLVVGEPLLTSAEVVADRDRLHQVVGNLLANCARHCRPGDRVDVSVRCEGGDAVLRVADTGPGIAPSDQPRIFERYWRTPQTTAPGSGLGLAVVAEVVAAHSGSIAVTSMGEGTTMTVRLPLGPVAPRRSGTQTGQA